MILDSVLRQWNGFEDFNVLNFGKISLKFAIVFKICECFYPFLSLTIITGQRSFSSLADGLLDITQERKNTFEQFHCKIWKLFILNFAIFANFLNISFLFDLFTNKARKLKV